ncbi:hypothetical protein D3C87_1942550 [compost metagenome]
MKIDLHLCALFFKKLNETWEDLGVAILAHENVLVPVVFKFDVVHFIAVNASF